MTRGVAGQDISNQSTQYCRKYRRNAIFSRIHELLLQNNGGYPAVARTISVIGSAPGFAHGVTGGGDATPIYPINTSHLFKLLGSNEPQVIILNRTYDFIGTEGTTKGTICKSWGPFEDGCQAIIDTGSGCGKAESDSYEWDTAGVAGIYVRSNKTIIGIGNKGVLLGKGLRMVDVSNIVIQNIMITNLNPKLVWGGDAFVLSGTSKIWIDHVTLCERRKPITRPHVIDNILGLELVGKDDQITFSNNYVYRTSGRSPALSGNTLFHAVNSVFENVNGHAIEGTANGQGLYEGCVFNNVSQIVVDDFVGQLFSSPSAGANKACRKYLGRDCVSNIHMDDGPSLAKADTGFFSNFTGLSVARTRAASVALKSVPTSAGNTLQNGSSRR